MPFDSLPAVTKRVRNRASSLDALRKARIEVAKPGRWCRGVLVGIDGTRCAVGWLMTIADCRTQRAGRLLALGLPPGEADIPPLHRVYRYNDTHTQEEVVGLFDRAIAALELQGQLAL